MKTLVALSCVLILINCQNNTSMQHAMRKTMMIKSEGEINVMPDMATFYVELSCLDKSIKKSKECLVQKSNELTDKLQSFGVKKEDLLTSSVDMSKSYTWNRNTRVFEGYRSSTLLNVTVRNMDKLEAIYTELIENRSLDLSGLNYSHSKMDSLKNEAYLNALKKADGLADKLLSQLPESKKEILKIGNVEIAASLPESTYFGGNAELKFLPPRVSEKEVLGENSISINRGTVSISATLYVEYAVR